MQLSEMIDLQKEFDLRHAGRFSWARAAESEPDAVLQFLLVALLGELGEMANLIKKVARGDCTLNDIQKEMRSELADVFIYVIKMADQANINLEEAFLNKLEYNEVRFRSFEKGNREVASGEREDETEEVLPASLESLHEAKYLSRHERIDFLSRLSARLTSNRDLAKRLQPLLGESIGRIGADISVTSALIALILADAVSTEDSIRRDMWLADFKIFCDEMGVPFDGVRRLASRASEVQTILSEYWPSNDVGAKR